MTLKSFITLGQVFFQVSTLQTFFSYSNKLEGALQGFQACGQFHKDLKM